MVFIEPVERVGDQKIGYLVFGIIKDLGTPVRVLAFARVGILIERLSVEIGKTVCILRKMRRNPV